MAQNALGNFQENGSLGSTWSSMNLPLQFKVLIFCLELLLIFSFVLKTNEV